MKRITAFIAVLLSICFTACKPKSLSGMEKAFGCEVGKTTLEEFCDLFPESSIEQAYRTTWGDGLSFLRGSQPDPREQIDVTVTDGSYYGDVYQHIRMCFDNGVLSDIGFNAYGTADEIDDLIAFFREEFSQYYKYEGEKTTLGISHHQIFFDDGLTTLMLWKRDYSQCEPGEFSLPKEIELQIWIVDDHHKSKIDYLYGVRMKKLKKQKGIIVP